ncbi:MAG: sodium/solute symporter [Planctomycetota bacterium]
MAATLLLLAGAAAQERLSWRELPPVPDAQGFGGAFVGVHLDRLIVAGGANFPDAPPWQGGTKVWYDSVFVLERGAAAWQDAGSLPQRRAYGAAVSVSGGVALLGGNDERASTDECLLLTFDPATSRARTTRLPSLPSPTAFPAAAAHGDVVWLAAGGDGSAPDALTHAFWSLDLGAAEPRWIERAPWPGPARHKAVAAVQSDGQRPGFFLFSGEVPRRAADGTLAYDYLRDAYRYDLVGHRWTRLGDLPVPVAAACALPVGQSHVLVFSGSTGEHVLAPDPRPEFPRACRAYHTITDTWTEASGMPQGVVTTGAVRFGDELVIASGEVRPGVRTTAVRAARLTPRPTAFGALDLTVLVLYLLALVAIGVRFARGQRDTDEFFLAGRRIPWWAAGISIFATQLSAITFVSTPALAYATDWLVLPGKAMIFVMAPIVVLLYLPFFRRLDITTAYELLERRFGLGVRLFGSASFVAFQLVRMAVVVYLPALALATLTGIDVYVCIAVMGVLATLYTVLGGMAAVIWTDVLQTVVLVGGMLAAIVVVAIDVGGFGAVWSVAESAGKTRLWNGSLSASELTSWSILLGTLMLQFGPYTTDQSVVQRYLTTSDQRRAARGIWLNGALAIPVGLLFFVLGTCLWAWFRQRPELLQLGMQNDEVFPLFVAERLPAGLAGLVIAGIFAASMSSLDSSMHSIATAATVDWYQRLGPPRSEPDRLRFARRLTLLLGVVAIASASALVAFDIKSLWLFFQTCLGLVSSGVVGAFALAVFSERATGRGVLVGAAASIAVLVWATFASDLHFYLYAVLGIGTCVVVGQAASLVLRDPPRTLPTN